MSALSLEQVKKTFMREGQAPLIALDGIDIAVPEGAIYGLLGPNGAGKSTLIHLLSGGLVPDQGSRIHLFDVDVVTHPYRAKQLLGIVPQETVVEMAFTVEEVLYYFCGMYGVPASERSSRIARVLEDLDLTAKRHDRARNLSGGMKRRLMIAKAILHRPRLLVLDEPTAGVDIALRQRVWEVVRRLNQDGTTIVFTTHYLEEAEQLCEFITLIDHGHVVKQGPLKDIQQEFAKQVIHFSLFDRRQPIYMGAREIGTEYELPITNVEKDIVGLIRYYGDNLKSFRQEHASLEQIFLELVTS